jgi:hypothetical protein
MTEVEMVVVVVVAMSEMRSMRGFDSRYSLAQMLMQMLATTMQAASGMIWKSCSISQQSMMMAVMRKMMMDQSVLKAVVW